MISKQEILSYLEEEAERPLAAAELADRLKVRDLPHLLALLRQLEEEGRVVVTRRRGYTAARKVGLVVGRVEASPRGFAFVVPDGGGEDIFILEGDLAGALHGDLVLVRLLERTAGRRPQGTVVRVLRRGRRRLLGTVVERRRRYAYVRPEERRVGRTVLVPAEKLARARLQDKVIVEITRWPEGRGDLEGRVAEVIGPAGDPATAIRALIRAYELPEEFGRQARREAARLPQEVVAEAMAGRRDLRSWRLVTIDPADARDLDDAVSLSPTAAGGYLLGVHIADVASYVPPNSALDREARRRGTSVYLPDRVLPMLPPELSNGICSLNAGEDRLAVSVLMELDREGRLGRYDLCRSVVRVARRLTYEEVQGLLEGAGAAERREYGALLQDLTHMGELATVLRQGRQRQGALEFNLPEVKVELDARGRAVGLRKVEHTLAHQIIEEFMILANRVVAEHLHWLEAPLLYRVHERPNAAAIEQLNEILEPLGYRLRRQQALEAGQIQRLLQRAAGRPEERLVHSAVLRAMEHARYSPRPLGHFGLATDLYCHFTSPIRRYPDLLVHRVLGSFLNGGMTPEERAALAARLEVEGEHTSARERVAEEVERAALEIKKAEYMAGFVGEVFPGIVAGVTAYGLFVELENTVQGLVRLSTLDDDYYEFVPERLWLVGRRTKKVYRIGQPVTVCVTRVEPEARQIDMELVP
ncbi:MAG: ribonuclease R [Clostridia bacterium]|nr:ribonuclease R [Clostridia bacterium]